MSRSRLQRLRAGGVSAADTLALFKHLAECGECALLARDEAGVGRATRELRRATFTDEEHPALETDLFAYADGTLPADRRAAVEEHLTHCRVCREDVADAVRTRQTMRRTPAPRQWWLAAAAAVALAIVGTLIWTRADREAPVRPINNPIRSVAVLPLRNSGSVSGDDFLAVALADSLATQLGDIPALQVRPMSAVLASHNVASLAVDSLIEGRFAVSGNLVQITLWLTDSRTGRSLWVGSMSGPRDNLLNVVENVSSQTLIALNEKLGVQRSGHASAPRSLNPVAFEEYLKARAVNQSLIPEKHAEEIAHLKRAIALDPQFAAAYADLAIAIDLSQSRGFDATAFPERYGREAVRLDPNLASAHLALGRVLFATNFRESMHEYVAAVRLNARDAQTLSILTSFLVASGEVPQAECLIDRLREIDPSSQEWMIRGYWYLNLLQTDAARRSAADALAHKSHELLGCDIAASAYVLEGNFAEADKYAARAARVLPASYIPVSLEAMIAAARGDRATALAKLQAYSADASRNRWAALRQATTYAKLGDRAQAVLWTRRSADLGNHSWYAMKTHPWMQSLQNDPDFVSTLQRIRADLDGAKADMLSVYETICGPALRQGARQGRQE